jgi:transcription elongation factor GreA
MIKGERGMLTTKLNITENGLIKLRQELKNLQDYNKNIGEKVRLAVISREEEHYAARIFERQNLERRITKLSSLINRAEVPRNNGPRKATVTLGSRVKIENGDQAHNLVLVDTVEIDPLNDRISIESPLGKALLGKKKGDRVQIDSPTGIKKFQITKVI